jgi:hypothetical protein
MAGSSQAATGKIYISYRFGNEETALSLAIRLSDQFGITRILVGHSWMDERGSALLVAIREAVAKCSILLALVGRNWAAIGDVGPKKGLINAPKDPVRVEIETALELSIPVIPVLVDDAVLPQADDLPPSLRPLTELRALTLRLDPLDNRRIVPSYAEQLVATLQAALAGSSGSMAAATETPKRPARRSGRREAAQKAPREEAGQTAIEAVLPEGRDVDAPAAAGPSTPPRGTRRLFGARAREGRSVFISYRRELSEPLARLIRNDLIEHRFDTFVDLENLDSGEFEQRILGQIEAREHFIVLLEPGSLDRIGKDGDWLRREIAHALAHGRNVVPVTSKGFEFRRDLVLPPDVARLASFTAVAIPQGYFDAAMDKLRTRFLKMPSNPTARS